MRIEYASGGGCDFAGLQIHADEITDELLPDFITTSHGTLNWSYYERSLGELLSDFLNCDFEHFASLCRPDLIVREDDGRYFFPKLGDPLFLPFRALLVEEIKQDFLNFPIKYCRKAADTIFAKDTLTLTAAQKWFAFVRVYNENEVLFGATSTVGFDYWPSGKNRDNFINRLGDWAVGPAQNIEDKSKKFSSLCRLISEEQQTLDVFYRYTFTSFRDMFIFCFNEYIKNNGSLKHCEHCGKYFSPLKAGSKYCDMPSPESPEKTCQEYMKYQKYLEKSHTEAVRLHKQIYNQKANKVRRTGNVLLQADLERFKEQSEQWRADTRDGIKSEEDYIEWLKDVKENGL